MCPYMSLCVWMCATICVCVCLYVCPCICFACIHLIDVCRCVHVFMLCLPCLHAYMCLCMCVCYLCSYIYLLIGIQAHMHAMSTKRIYVHRLRAFLCGTYIHVCVILRVHVYMCVSMCVLYMCVCVYPLYACRYPCVHA